MPNSMIAAVLTSLLGMQSVTPTHDGAPPVIVAMVPPADIEGAPLRQPQGDGYSCAAGYAICARIVPREGQAAELEIFDMDAAARDFAAFPLPFMTDDTRTTTLSVWDQAIRLPLPSDVAGMASAYLIGIVHEQRTMYSGGGGSGARLTLHELIVGNDGSAQLGREVASLPWRGSLMIRACFNEEDVTRRRGACHDEYGFGANLTIAGNEDRRFPELRFETQASAYPQTARRGEDSNAEAPLRASDLNHWRDPECSYARTLRFNPASERYEMDRIAPNCSSYTVP
jgi:hypothetical protein